MFSPRSCRPRSAVRPGFTMVEVLVVIGVIALLVAILLPALGGAFSTGKLTKSQSNLRQIASFMQLYSADNQDFVVPSQFNHTYPNCPDCYRGKVRSIAPQGHTWDYNGNSVLFPAVGDQYRGTWTDILWVSSGLPTSLDTGDPADAQYAFDSPDAYFMAKYADEWEGRNPFRSLVENTKRNPTGPAEAFLPLPYDPAGVGSAELGAPGYFAANNFFNADGDSDTFEQFIPGSKNGLVTNAQIRYPNQGLYAVDSWAGEVIEDLPEPYDNLTTFPGSTQSITQVDFRYSGGLCLMLFLDGHSEPRSAWDTIDNLEGTAASANRVRVRNLTSR